MDWLLPAYIGSDLSDPVALYDPRLIQLFFVSSPQRGTPPAVPAWILLKWFPSPPAIKQLPPPVKGGCGGWNSMLPSLPAAQALARCFLHPFSFGAKRKLGVPGKCYWRDWTFSPQGPWHPDGAPCTVGLIIRCLQGCSRAGGDFHLPSDLLEFQPSFMGAIKVIF